MKIQFRKNEKLAYMAVAGVVILLLLAGVLLNWQRGAFVAFLAFGSTVFS